MKKYLLSMVVTAAVTACATTNDPLDEYEELTPTRIIDAPGAGPSATADAELIGHGRYLVELIGCAACHTAGALSGEPELGEPLAGSDTGIAYSNPLKSKDPGVVFPSNLTPDLETGIGRWSDEQIIGAIRGGLDVHGRRLVQVMPWLVYEKITDNDARAIVAYLRSLEPVKNRVPENVPAGVRTSESFVYFGVYRSRE